MESRKHIAAEKKRCNSHNCAQAVLHTYAKQVATFQEALTQQRTQLDDLEKNMLHQLQQAKDKELLRVTQGRSK